MVRMIPSRAPGLRLRATALALHRYVGLVLATFLLVAGLTGSLIAFYEPLDALLHPHLFRAEPADPSAQPLDPFVMREKVNAQLPAGKTLNIVTLHREPGRTIDFWLDGHQYFADPYTGALRGARKWGDLSEGMVNLMPFLYAFHFSLGLEEVGAFVFGLVALVWMLDCFVGLYLTFPQPQQRRAGGRQKSWLARWLPSWLVKTTKLFTAVFTWHRASGLWVWGMFLIFAWSAVAINLHDEVHEPVMRALFGPDPHGDELPALAVPLANPALSMADALSLGRRAMAEESKRRGFRILDERALTYEPEHGIYTYGIESSLDISDRLADTYVTIDANDGRLLRFDAPTGVYAGTTFTSWIVGLHFGSVRELGMPYRVFVCLMGFVVALLSVSGVWIWWKKRTARVINKQPRKASVPAPQPAVATRKRRVDTVDV